MENPIAEIKNLLNQLEQAADNLAKKNGIEHLAGPQGRVLIYLKHHQDDEVFVKDIENHLCISKSVASNLVKRMERNGFIKTVPSQADKRYKRIILTNLGWMKLKPMEAFHQQMQEILLKDIDFADIKTIRKVTDQLRTNLKTYRKNKG
ncbi:MarR family winged helix-turn-helix transcriptional regulator [Streptococcus dentiloxodontae]